MYLSLAFCLMFCEVDVVVGCVGFIFSLIVFLVGSQAAKTMEGKREWVHLNYGGKEVGVCLHLTTSIPLLRGGGGGGDPWSSFVLFSRQLLKSQWLTVNLWIQWVGPFAPFFV